MTIVYQVKQNRRVAEINMAKIMEKTGRKEELGSHLT